MGDSVPSSRRDGSRVNKIQPISDCFEDAIDRYFYPFGPWIFVVNMPMTDNATI
jgi:hypothetical protein